MSDDAPILARVRRLVVRLAPTWVCAQCIAERAEGLDIEAVSLALSELAATREFERASGACDLCGEHRLTIRKHG